MRQAREYSLVITSQQETEGKKWCYVTLTQIRSGLSLRGVDSNSILIQVALQRST